MNALEQLNSIVCWDYRIQSFDGYRLVLVGGTDLCYYHLVEAEFEEVDFISCPSSFSHARFRQATRAERSRVSRLVGIEDGATLFAIEAESCGSLEPQVFFILAQSIKVTEGTVYYYQRDDLQPGERIAEWVSQRQAKG
jgi:hypothetical protein